MRVTNDGPGTLTNKKVEISCTGTVYDLTTAEGKDVNVGSPACSAMESTLNLAPGQTQTINVGWQIDVSQYRYDFIVTVTAKDFTDPNSGNNGYAESVGADSRASFVNLHACFDATMGHTTYLVENTGTMTFESQGVCGYGPVVDYLRSPLMSSANDCPPAGSSLAPGEKAHVVCYNGHIDWKPRPMTIDLCVGDYSYEGPCVRRSVNP